MSITQKYKQQQQQVRIQTSESNYIKGMYFSDVPLAEGYSRALVNLDIDHLSGKLTPRKGLKSIGLIRPTAEATQYLDNTNGLNTIIQSRVCSASDSADPRKINRILQSVLYNTDTRSLSIASCAADIQPDSKFNVIPFTLNSKEEFVTPEPYVIAEPGIHNQKCLHNEFFKKPVGTFAFNNNYYTFLKRNKYSVKKIAELPNADYVDKSGQVIRDYDALRNNSEYAIGTPGQYFKFASGISAGIIAYYDVDNTMQVWKRSEEALMLEVFAPLNDEYILCYTKLGADIQPDEILLNEQQHYEDLQPDVYYTCRAIPQLLKPNEASSWGYNMLSTNPYTFKCEETAVNNVNILGMLVYDKSGKYPVLTPRINEEITLKGYYRAPKFFHTATENPQFYATTKIGEYKTKAELDASMNAPSTYKYGDWWYCTEPKEYFMIMPTFQVGAEQAIKSLELFGTTKPAASEKLSALNKEGEDPIRVRWQMRSSGASDWIDLYNETFTLTEYYNAHGAYAPFTLTTAIPASEAIIRLSITDPSDIDSVTKEEYVLSTNTIGISLVTDELANKLNISAKRFNLGQCTGMCEWEQHLVLWGVPGALNTIFISDVNNPTFFPYPNNVDVFTDPIIAVHNYGNELLVLTTTALYRLIWDTQGTGWTHRLVQQNLHVREEDTYMSCVIKNMFFFKSGEYYFMMVPKAAAIQGEVAIAPISKPITGLLDNFHKEVYNIVKVMLDKPNINYFPDKLIDYFSYVDNNKVVVNYVYDITALYENSPDTRYLFVQLIYDTEARAWNMHTFEAAHMLYPSHTDAIQQKHFIDITPAYTTDKLVIQYYELTDIIDSSIQYIKNTGEQVFLKPIVKNYQYLDTGNREINTDMKKRFREFQFKIKNKTMTNLGFYTSFLIDGSLRRDLQQYSPRFIVDETTGENTIVVERTLDTSSKIHAHIAYATTRVERIIVPKHMLQDNGELTPTIIAKEDDPDRWVLNQSAFPGRTLWKIRMTVSGKGFSPRAILLSTNEAEFELLGHSWVYRTMNSR